MTDASIAVREAAGADFDRVEALLAANDLPHRDVRTGPGRFFLARSGGEFVGVGGVETYGPDGLLRSVVVREPYRGRGYGTALCAALEEQARERGVETLYLLTTTAAAFFRRRGYEAIPRERVPPKVRETSEFADLCPASAACMRREIR